jgi:hypothetical protein
MAVKQSIVDVMFDKPELNRLLAAQNVQPIKIKSPVPEVAVVNLEDFVDGAGRYRLAPGASLKSRMRCPSWCRRPLPFGIG